MDPETLNRAIEIIQANPSAYGINPQPINNRVTTSGGTIQINDGPVETFGDYNNRLKQEEEQRAINTKAAIEKLKQRGEYVSQEDYDAMYRPQEKPQGLLGIEYGEMLKSYGYK